MGIRVTCALTALLCLMGSLAEASSPLYKVIALREHQPLDVKSLFADELNVAGPTFSANLKKRDVSHVLPSTSNNPSGSGASSGSGSFSSSSSFAGSGSGGASVGPGGGYSGSGKGTDGSQSAYAGLATSYNPNPGFQDYYSNNAGAYPYYPYQNSVPNFGAGFDFQTFMQQYFNSLQQQQQAIQAQLQAQQQAGGRYSWANSWAYMTNPDGRINPNARYYSYSHSWPGQSMSSSVVDFGSGRSGFSSSSIAGNRFYEISNRLGYGSPYTQQFPSSANFGGQGSYGGNPGYSGSSAGSGPHTAVASANIGPQGGHQAGEISPVAPGIVSRFGEDVPAPSGNSFGVFTSSSSGHSVGPDGKETSFKTATTGVNDNGKVTYHTVHDP